MNIDIVKVLVENEININQRGRDGRICLSYVSSLRTAEYLYENGIDINNLDNRGSNLLHIVKYPIIAQWLIGLGLDVNQVNLNRIIPIFSNSDEDVVKVLIKNGADVNFRSLQGFTIFRFQLNNPDIVDYLFKGGYVNLDHKLIQTNNYAALIKNPKSLLILIANGLNVNHQNMDIHDQNTALHRLSNRGLIELVLILIDNGANVNIQDYSGRTPIYYASSIDIAQLLIRRGARLDITDSNGETPIEANRFVAKAVKIL